jgi:hypothetical protein
MSTIRRATVLMLAVGLSACAEDARRQVDGASAPPAAGPRHGTVLQAAASPAAEREMTEAQGRQLASGTAGVRVPEYREVTIPAGTTLNLRLTSAVASDTSRVEDRVQAEIAKPVMIDGIAAVPDGATIAGSVVNVERSGKVKGRASLSLRFHSLTAWNDAYDVETATISRRAAATKGEDAAKIGIGSGAGALIGAVAGGKKGAAIGGAIGAGAGTGVVMATRGEEVRLGPGAVLTTTLQEPLTVRVAVE